MKQLFYFLLLLIPQLVYAEKVAEPKARKMAIEFLQQHLKTRANGVEVRLVDYEQNLSSRTHRDCSNPYFIYNNIKGDGFVIISGEDQTQPVLGFSDKGSFSATNMPENVKTWLTYMKEQVSKVRSQKKVRDAKTQNDWEHFEEYKTSTLYQMETADWDQKWPYNNDCPTIDGEKAPTGCVITATAIVMKWNAWPKCGIGEIPGYTYNNNGKVYQMPKRKLGECYDWERMPLTYDSESSEEEQAQIARLMADLGTLLHAQYSAKSTGTYTTKIVQMLPKFMQYQENCFYQKKNDFTDLQWEKKIQKELQLTGPVIYDGLSEKSGHAFVIDGYSENSYFHINWGWGGMNNGYFSLNAVNDPDEDSHQFTRNQGAIFGLKEDESNMQAAEFCELDLLVSRNTNIQLGSSFFVNISLNRDGRNLPKTYDVSVWLTDKYGNLKEKLSDDITVKREELTDRYTRKAHLSNVQCICKNGFVPGDRVRVFFKSTANKVWTLPTHKESAWELIIADNQGKFLTIDGDISLDFDRRLEILTINHSKDIKVQVRYNGSDITNRGKTSDTQYTISVLHLMYLNIELIFRQGEALKTVLFKNEQF